MKTSISLAALLSRSSRMVEAGRGFTAGSVDIFKSTPETRSSPLILRDAAKWPLPEDEIPHGEEARLRRLETSGPSWFETRAKRRAPHHEDQAIPQRSLAAADWRACRPVPPATAGNLLRPSQWR